MPQLSQGASRMGARRGGHPKLLGKGCGICPTHAPNSTEGETDERGGAKTGEVWQGVELGGGGGIFGLHMVNEGRKRAEGRKRLKRR